MKARKLVGTVLLSALTFGLAIPNVLAAGESLPGRGTVTFEEDDTITKPTDPEEPGKPVVVDPEEGTEQTEQGPLSVDFVSVLKFGSNKLTPNAAREYYATPTAVTNAGAAVTRGNYVQVTDKRTGTSKQGWKLSAAITTPFTNTVTNHVIDTASIAFSNPFVNSTQADVADVTANGALLLTSDGTVDEVATAPVDKGWGTYTIAYGKTEDTNIGTSVKLTVPTATPLDIDDPYVATITWTVANL